MNINKNILGLNKNNRVMYIDIARGIAIISVIIAHVFPKETYISKLVYLYLIPSFFIYAGLLVNSKRDESLSIKMILNNNKDILIIYLSISVVYTLYDVIVHGMILGEKSLLILIRWDLLQTFSFFGINVLWFLSALYITKIIFGILTKVIKCENKRHFIILLVSLFAIFIGSIVDKKLGGNNHQGIVTIIYFLSLAILRPLGLLIFLDFGNKLNKIIRLIQKNNGYYLIYIVGFLLIIITILVAPFSGNIDWHYMKFENIFLMFFISIIGSAGILFLCILIENYFRYLSKVLSYFGRNSLLIMILHNYIIIDLLSNFNQNLWNVTYIGRFLIVLLGTLILTILLENTFNRFRLLLKKYL